MTTKLGNGVVRDGKHPLGELSLLFLRLGTTAFGGPAAHIAMMQDEVVARRMWVTSEEFLDLLGATNLIPGPNSTEMAIQLGLRRAGWRGLLVAGICFIAPATLITFVLAWAYVRFGSIPRARGVLYGVKPVIISVVVQAIWSLGKTALKDTTSRVVAVCCLAAVGLGLHELAVLFGAGAVVVAIRERSSRASQQKTRLPPPASRPSASPPPPPPSRPPLSGSKMLASLPLGSLGQVAIGYTPAKLFLVFLKIGAILFGSGYVLLAFLRNDLVDRLHWMSEKQLIDAVAVGQLTPGPVSSTATFIGYLIGGRSGAVLATLGIFLPSFLFVAASGPLVPHLRRSARARAFIDGVNVAAWALMTAVTWNLGRAALVDAATVVFAITSAVLLLRFKVNSAWLVVGGAVVGALWNQVVL